AGRRRRRGRSDGGRRRDRLPPDPRVAPLLRRLHPAGSPLVGRAPARRRARARRRCALPVRRPAQATVPRGPGGVGGRTPRCGRLPAVRRRRQPQGARSARGPLRRRPAALRPGLERVRPGSRARRGAACVAAMNDVHEHGVHGWLAAAPVVTVLVATTLAGGYLVLVRRRERTLGRRWSGLRTGAWLAGAVLVAAGLSPWTVEAAHADARGHMAQHLLLGMYAPLGVVLAAPMTLLLGA